jgi:predicted Zn-dependent protease
MSSRIPMLQQVLEQNPADTFARYGLAMEYSNANDVEHAMQHFNLLLKSTPDYAPGYFMAAQLLARNERIAEAVQYLKNGVAAARRTGNRHAESEMSAMLDELEEG